MAVIVTNLLCELQSPGIKVQYLEGNLFSQDNQANRFNITVLDGGQPASISGSVTADVIRSDGGTVAVTGGTISGNVVSISFPAAVYAVPGVVSIVVKVTASSVVTTIAAVVANVYRSSTDTAIDPGTIIPSIQTLISVIETAVASIPADYSSLWTSLAPAFNPSNSYSAGQYVTYNGAVYRFNTSHTGSWSSGDVTAVNLGGELTSLKSAFIDEIGTYDIPQTFTTGYNIKLNVGVGNTVDLTPNSSVSWKYMILSVVPGEVYVVSAKGGSSPRAYGIIDSSNKLLEVAADGATVSELSLTMPTGAAKLIVNTNTTYSSAAVIKKQIIDKAYIDKKTANYEKVINAISKDQLESGGWSNNEKTVDSKRIRYGSRIKVDANTVFRLVNSNLFYSVAIYETEASSTALEESGWINVPYTNTHAGYVIIAIANASTYGTSTTITVDDFGNSIFVVSQIDMPQKVYDVSFGMHMIIGSNKIPEFSYSNHVLSVVIPASVSLTYCGGKTGNGYTVFTPADILSQLGSSKFSYDENSMTFSIGSDYGVLYFDTQTLTFGINNGSTRVYDNWLVLVLNWYGNIYGDWVYKTAYEELAQNINPSISNLIEYSGIVGSPYYSKLQSYADLLFGTGESPVAPETFENFIWFTDPHTMYGDYTFDVSSRTYGCKHFDNYIAQLEFAYNSTPTDFVICGGDWNDGGEPAPELFKLSRAVERCKAKLSPFYEVVGNHDTNYQGTAMFTPKCIADLWYRESGKCYYTFNGRNTKFYVIDTQAYNTYISDSTYLQEQYEWFLSTLQADNSQHIVIVMHMYYYLDDTVLRFSNSIMNAACAYNARSSVTFNGVTYNYSNATGKVEFALAGHSHADFKVDHTSNGATIPVIGSINAGNANGSSSSYYGAKYCNFDLVNVNYDESTSVINLIRIGEQGTDRTYSCAVLPN